MLAVVVTAARSFSSSAAAANVAKATTGRCLSSVTVAPLMEQLHHENSHRPFLSSFKQKEEVDASIKRRKHSSSSSASSQDERRRIINKNKSSFSVMEVMVPILDVPEAQDDRSGSSNNNDVVDNDNLMVTEATTIEQDPLVKQLAFKLQKVKQQQRQYHYYQPQEQRQYPIFRLWDAGSDSGCLCWVKYPYFFRFLVEADSSPPFSPTLVEEPQRCFSFVGRR